MRGRWLRALLVTLAAAQAAPATALEGFDPESDDFVDLPDDVASLRPGSAIAWFDYASGEYRRGRLQAVYRFGSQLEVEVLDLDSEEVHRFEIDR